MAKIVQTGAWPPRKENAPVQLNFFPLSRGVPGEAPIVVQSHGAQADTTHQPATRITISQLETVIPYLRGASVEAPQSLGDAENLERAAILGTTVHTAFTTAMLVLHNQTGQHVIEGLPTMTATKRAPFAAATEGITIPTTDNSEPSELYEALNTAWTRFFDAPGRAANGQEPLPLNGSATPSFARKTELIYGSEAREAGRTMMATVANATAHHFLDLPHLKQTTDVLNEVTVVAAVGPLQVIAQMDAISVMPEPHGKTTVSVLDIKSSLPPTTGIGARISQIQQDVMGLMAEPLAIKIAQMQRQNIQPTGEPIFVRVSENAKRQGRADFALGVFDRNTGGISVLPHTISDRRDQAFNNIFALGDQIQQHKAEIRALLRKK